MISGRSGKLTVKTLAPCLPVVAMLGLSPPPVRGQEHQPERPRPAAQPVQPNEPAARTSTPANPLVTDGAIPGLDRVDSRIKASPLRAEGTILTEQRGSMLRLPSGEWAFVFHEDARGRRERPMVLAPCQNLQRMEQLAAERGPGTVFAISGQVLAYLQVNYLLTTRYSIVPAPAPDAASPGPGSTPNSRPETSAASSGDDGVQSLIRALEAQRDPTRIRGSSESSAPQPAEAPTHPTVAGADTAGLLPEGTAVLRRRGRLARSGDGQWAVTFDNGPAGTAGTDRPLTVVPCMNLVLMERWAGLRGEGVTFEVSGRILTCDSRNYVLPAMFQVYPTNDLEPRQ